MQNTYRHDQGRLVPKLITTCTKYNSTFTPFHWKNSVVINLRRTDTILPSWTAMNVYYKTLCAVLTNVWSIYVFLVLFFKQILLSNQESTILNCLSKASTTFFPWTDATFISWSSCRSSQRLKRMNAQIWKVGTSFVGPCVAW